MKVEIRDGKASDAGAIEPLYRDAFPDEDLIELVLTLAGLGKRTLSLLATVDSRIRGHVVFTHCGIDGSPARAALLGPLAVSPDAQRRGIGSRLVRSGLERMREAGVDCVCVLGDPAYYGRLGFLPETRIGPPYPLPDEWQGAWQSRYLTDTEIRTGTLTVPAPWQDPALWAP